MAQEPSSRDLLEAVKQQESGGRRYKADGRTLLEGPPTKYGTAKGEMQVLDMTNRDPGFGVRPAKNDSADERARVGRDYLAAMKKRYGDTETGLIAYNWGPGNTDKWLKKGADPAKLPKETQNYVTKIMASLGGPDVSRETSAVATAPKKAAPKPVAVAAAKPGVAGTTSKKPAPTPVAAAPVTVASMDSRLADLGPSYQAALALSFLADTDEKEDRDIDREPGVAEKYLAEMEAAPRPAALSEFIDVKIRSPFAEAQQPEQPLGMAEGGVVRRAKGSPEEGEVAYFQDPLGVPDSGPVTSDTLSKGKEFSAADALRALKETGTGVARNVKNIAKGTTETPYNLVGSVADIGNMALIPFGLDSKEPALGSAHLKRLATEAGIRPAPPTDPRDAGYYMMGELGSSIVNPAGVVRSGVKATGKAADLLRDLKKPKEVPQTAPAPAPMAGPTPEVLTELAQMSEQRQLPRNAAQAPDPLIGVRPTLAEAQANVTARQAEQLPPPPAEVVVPPEMLEMPPVAPPMQATAESVVRPFTGRLDSFVETIKNPVQLGQLKGQLKGKFRDYDLERVERAFAGMDDKTKLTPDQIKQALAGVHSPGKWISETLPPEKGKYHQNMDNIWGKELGTTNLYLEQPEQTLLATKLFDEGGTSLGAFVANSTTTPTLKKLEDAKKLLSNPDLTKFANPDLVSRISAKLDTAENNIKLIDQFGQDIQNIERGFARPVLFQQNGENVWFKFKDDFIKGKKTEIEQQFMDQGMTRSQALSATHDKLFGNNNAVYLAFVREAEIASSKKVQDLAREQARSHSINIPDLGINWNNPSLKPMDPLSVTTSVNAQTDRAQAALKTALEPSVQTVHEASKNVQRFMSDDVKELGLVLQNVAAYRGKHKGVAASPYPIGFTRFSEHEATVPGMGTVQGRHFHELQSDLSKDMRKSGTVGGSAAKDTKELDSLQVQINKHRDDTFAQVQAFQQENKNGTLDYAGYMEKQQKARDALENKINPLERRISVLSSRIRSNAPYSLQEPFAGFETNPMVRQQLLMKNAIQSAMRDGKSFATFPGNESAKPQLYVGKIQPNLKQVIKDLGGEKSGLELRQIELPPDKDGNSITATGVVWSPEAAARIMKTGVPFAKGGMVQGYAKGGIADLPKSYDEEDFTTLKPFIPNTGDPGAVTKMAIQDAKMTPAQREFQQKVNKVINDARPMAFTIAKGLKDYFFPVTSTGGIGDGGDGPVGTVTVGALSPADGDGDGTTGVSGPGGNVGIGNGATTSGQGTGIGSLGAIGGGLANGGMIERQFIDNRRYM